MAHILPDTTPMVFPSVVHKTFEALKRLPDSYHIWHHLAPWEPSSPDFLIVSHDLNVLVVKVSASTNLDVTPATQLLLIDNDRPNLGKNEAVILSDFIQSLELPLELPIETLVVFPNIPHKAVIESRLERKPNEPHWAGREILSEQTSIAWEMFLPSGPVDEIWLEKIRQCFTPEIVVHQNMTTRVPKPEKIEAGLTGFLLDYDQEKALKTDLELDPEGGYLPSDFRLNIINGVAGSGKTLILLYRLRLLYHLYPKKNFLVLTHNKPLRKDLESRFFRLEGHLPENIAWHTFFSWCHEIWTKKNPWVSPISMKNRSYLIQEVWQNHLKDTSITEYMLLGEIDWIKDQRPLNEEQYLNVDRRGRGFGLTVDQRQRMWWALKAYQTQLKHNGTQDWADIPQQLWHWITQEKITMPKYDAILIDEAQFFAPLWMDLVKKALKSTSTHLFLVADPTQGFLGRRATWKSMGLEARGRTYLLQKSYRATQEIMQFATLFYRQRLPNEKDDDILVPNLLDMPTGAFPEIIPLSSAQDEIARVANEVAAFLRQGFPRKDIYLLHANPMGVKALIKAINRRVGNNTALDAKTSYPGNFVRVATINAGPGLESPIVFLVGLRTLFEEEQSLRLSDDERAALIEENTRKIFMASTRAGQRLVFTYVGELPKEFQTIFSKNNSK
jgi:superfamily I DNA/RNA helicase